MVAVEDVIDPVQDKVKEFGLQAFDNRAELLQFFLVAGHDFLRRHLSPVQLVEHHK